MSLNRYSKRIDSNQPEIVKELRRRGISVELNHDDILVGYNGETRWYEIKHPDCLSKKTGKVLDSKKKKHQIELENKWRGHYRIITSVDEILEDLCLK